MTAAAPPTTAARLATLPRYQGRTVLFVVPWGGCRKVRTRDAELGWVENCECVPGLCTPHFGQLCPTRQRQVMLGRAWFSLSGDSGPRYFTPAEAKAATRQGRTVTWVWAASDNPTFYTIGEWLQHVTEKRR